MQSQLLSHGEETIDRSACSNSAGAAITGSTLRLTYFTARKTETISYATTYTLATAAATITLCRIGIYSVGSPTGFTNAGPLTLEASTTNDTAIWASANTQYVVALTDPWTKRAGTRYAVGVLCVATTPPVLMGHSIQNASMGMWPDAISSKVNTQTNLPATVLPASNVESSMIVQTILLP